MDLEELRRKRKELTDKAEAFLRTADTENRNLYVEEANEFEHLMAQARDLAVRIDREEQVRELQEDVQRSHRLPTKPGTQQTPPGQPKQFRSLGEQMQAVAQATRPGATVDQRLLHQRAALGLSEGVPADGGFFVQQDFSSRLIERSYEVGQLARRCQRIPLSSNANGIKLNGIDETSRVDGSRWGGVQAYWAAEADTVTASKPKFRQIEMNLHKLFAVVYATDELLADASALESVTSRIVSQEIAYKLDKAILRGNGVGQPMGILNSNALVTVNKESGQLAATLQSENIINMWSRGEGRTNAIWAHNQDVEPQLFQFGIQVGVGGSLIWMPPGGISGRPYSTLFGQEMVAIEQASTLGTVGDIGLFDMSQYLLIDKPAQAAMSIHVQFLSDQTVFRFVYRVDGQPAMHSALTPENGTATRAPFVVLQTRS